MAGSFPRSAFLCRESLRWVYSDDVARRCQKLFAAEPQSAARPGIIGDWAWGYSVTAGGAGKTTTQQASQLSGQQEPSSVTGCPPGTRQNLRLPMTSQAAEGAGSGNKWPNPGGGKQCARNHLRKPETLWQTPNRRRSAPALASKTKAASVSSASAGTKARDTNRFKPSPIPSRWQSP